MSMRVVDFAGYLLVPGSFLAGGSLRAAIDNTEVKDFDYFFSDKQAVSGLESKLIEKGYNVVFRCPEGRLVTLKHNEYPKAQLITEHFYKTPEDAINSFDITASMYAYSDGKLYLGPNTLEHTAKKEIHLHTLSHPAATMKRFLKYVDKGYTLPNSTIEEYLKRVNTMTLDQQTMRFYID